MAVTTRFPTTNAAYSGVGLTNPNNLHADDGVYGTAAPAKNGGLGTRYGTFGFDGDIPDGSTIDAVKILYQFKVSVTGSVAIQRVKARIGAVDEENHDNTNEPTSDTAVTVDITSDRTWTRDDLLDGTFEAVAEARRGNTNTAYTASWDYIKVEVTYTEPVGPVTYQQAVSATAVGTASTARTRSLKTTLTATATGAATIGTGLVLRQALASSAVGTATIALVLAFGVTLVATAVGTATQALRLSLKRTLEATASGTAATTVGLVLRQALTGAATGAATIATSFYEYVEPLVDYMERCWTLSRRRFRP